jgi:hypothetical protein
MEITTREHKRCTVIRVVGRVDAATAPQFEARLREYIEADKSNLVLEMDATDYMSSAAVGGRRRGPKAREGPGGRGVRGPPPPRGGGPDRTRASAGGVERRR